MALDSAQESKAQKPSDLLHFSGNLSELLTSIFTGWLNCKAEIICLFIFLFVSLYILSNLNSKMTFVKY